MIRNAKIPDVPEIQQLINHFADMDLMLPRSLSAIYEDLRNFYVLEKNGKILGCCALNITWSDFAEIRSLAIDESVQGKGYGKALVEKCLDDAQTLGVPKVFTLTYVPGFFEAMGFYKADKSTLPKKIWSDCIHCPKFPNCNEEAVIKEL